MKKTLLIIGIVILALAAGVYFLMAPAIKAMSKTSLVTIDANLKILTGGGGNSVVYIYPDQSSVIVIDTKMGGAAKNLKAYVDAINPKAAVTVINTHAHADHTGGNKLYPGAAFITGECQNLEKSGLNWTLLKAGQVYTIKTPDDEIELRDMGPAHSFADTVVYFKKRKLLVTGDLVFNGWHPVLIKQGGADTNKWTAALDFLMKNYAINTAVPGHGSVSGTVILQAQKTYFEEIDTALGDPARLKTLKEKYSGYYHIPLFSGFDESARFMGKEK